MNPPLPDQSLVMKPGGNYIALGSAQNHEELDPEGKPISVPKSSHGWPRTLSRKLSVNWSSGICCSKLNHLQGNLRNSNIKRKLSLAL